MAQGDSDLAMRRYVTGVIPKHESVRIRRAPADSENTEKELQNAFVSRMLIAICPPSCCALTVSCGIERSMPLARA